MVNQPELALHLKIKSILHLHKISCQWDVDMLAIDMSSSLGKLVSIQCHLHGLDMIYTSLKKTDGPSVINMSQNLACHIQYMPN